MFSYNPEKFASLFATPTGRDIWNFMTSSEAVVRLETASELGKPAVEGIQELLLDAFGDEVLIDRTKQMIGHMARQVMEQRGWIIDQSEVRVLSVPFIKATRYRRPEWFTLHAFRNTGDPRDVAITDRRQNPILPQDARWIYYVTFSSPLKASVAFAINDLGTFAEEVRSRGYKRLRVQRMLRRA
jgi:hypothetical protein